uniref:RL domain-containing protein n=1 Tax=Neogobius melanostomus TaxID=47308 RepID=A0A8C6U7G3_9GOBI
MSGQCVFGQKKHLFFLPLSEKKKKNGPKSLRDLRAERQAQAERSVLVSCHPKTHENKFLKYLSRHGNVNKCFFYESFVSNAS